MIIIKSIVSWEEMQIVTSKKSQFSNSSKSIYGANTANSLLFDGIFTSLTNAQAYGNLYYTTSIKH